MENVHLLFFNNCLSIALYLLHDDLFFFWQQDLRDTLFPYCCTQRNRDSVVTSPSVVKGGLSDGGLNQPVVLWCRLAPVQ